MEEYPSLAEGIGLENRQAWERARVRILLPPPFFYYRGVEQLVARWAHNPEVVGSNPSSATIWSHGVVVNMSVCHTEDRGFKSRWDRHFVGSVAQSVEQRTENPCVGGSIPPWATILQ